MRYVLLIILLSGCQLDSSRSLSGCESFQYLCVGCYNQCGNKNIDIEENIEKPELLEEQNVR